jgi:DNA-binding transcriptional regulator YiaG
MKKNTLRSKSNIKKPEYARKIVHVCEMSAVWEDKKSSPALSNEYIEVC